MGIDIYFCKVNNNKSEFKVDYIDDFSDFKDKITEIDRECVDLELFKEKYGIEYGYDMYDGENLYFYKDDFESSLFNTFDSSINDHCKLIVSVDNVPYYNQKTNILYCEEVDYYRKGYGSDTREIMEFIRTANEVYDRTDMTKKEFIELVNKLDTFDLVKYKDVDFDMCIISY